jgi:CHASE2 domain-containing sensor protein
VLLEPAPVARLHELVFDAYQRLMPRPRESAPAVIVEIDERALDAQGQWPWPRTRVAELVRAIARARPAAIGLDLLFTEPDRSAADSDRSLAQALQESTTVLGIAGLEQPDRRFPHPPQAAPVRLSGARDLPLRRFPGHLQSRSQIDQAASGRGLISADMREGVVRTIPLVAHVNGVLTPTLTIELLRTAAGLPSLSIVDDGGEDVGLQVGDIAIPMQSDGSLQIYFAQHDDARFISAQDVLAGEVPSEALSGKVVLLGVTGLGLIDYQATPLGERVPGVEIHAQILEQIFDGAYLHRAGHARWLEAALLLAAGLLLVAVVPVAKAWTSALLGLALLASLLLGGILAFRAGSLVDPAAPAAGVVLVFGSLLAFAFAEADRQRRRLREAQARVAGELEAARRIQMGLLPDPRALFAREQRFALDATLSPARTVGGDFYDCFMVDEHRLFFVVADVSGKGLPASLFMALSKSLLKSIALRQADADPGAMLTLANAEIGRDNPESLFVTAYAGVLDTRTGGLEFSNAGHEPAVSRREGTAPEVLEHAGGPPLCVIEGFQYPTAHRQLSPGETLCVVTDGVTEAMDRRGELYGARRVRLLLAASLDASPRTLVDALIADVRRFADGAEQADDVTLLSVRWNGYQPMSAAGAVCREDLALERRP